MSDDSVICSTARTVLLTVYNTPNNMVLPLHLKYSGSTALNALPENVVRTEVINRPLLIGSGERGSVPAQIFYMELGFSDKPYDVSLATLLKLAADVSEHPGTLPPSAKRALEWRIAAALTQGTEGRLDFRDSIRFESVLLRFVRYLDITNAVIVTAEKIERDVFKFTLGF